MRIEYYDADTHDLIRRDAYSQALVDALRERDEARAEVERLRAAPPVYLTDIDKSVGAISGIVGVSNAAAVRECITKHTRPLDQTPPTVNLTDIEAASYDVCAANYPGGIDSDRAEEVLRKHTRAVSVESVAQALYESAAPRTVHDWPLASGVTKETYIVQARAALRAIGARLAENTGTGAPVPTQHPENQHGYGIRRHVRSADERQAADGSGNRSEDRIPRADSAGVVGGEGVPTPGIEPGEAARGPQGDGSRPALDCHRADALPGGPDGCGSRGDATGVLLTRVAALESALRLETDLRVHGDAVIGARLNLLIKAAPDVGAGLAEPEPAAPVAPQAEPASAPRGEWTEEQREAAWDMHLRTRGYTIDCNAARDHICLALAHVAPLFAPEPAKPEPAALHPPTAQSIDLATIVPSNGHTDPDALIAKPRGGFVVDRDRFNGIANRAGLAVARAIDECIAEIERQRAEWAGGTK